MKELMAIVGLRSITIYCTDLEKTKQFYEAIGLELHKMHSDWSYYYYNFAELENDLTIDIVLADAGKIFSNKNVRSDLVFVVDDVSEILKNLAKIQTRILAPHPSTRHNCDKARVEDPDGRPIGLRKRPN